MTNRQRMILPSGIEKGSYAYKPWKYKSRWNPNFTLSPPQKKTEVAVTVLWGKPCKMLAYKWASPVLDKWDVEQPKSC